MSKSKKLTTYAFIDSQNLNLAVRDMGWKLDFARFRVYLKEKYGVDKAYILIGYVHCLVNYLITQDKLSALIVPNRNKYSALLKLKDFKPFTRAMNDLRKKLEYKAVKKKNPRKDATLKGKSSIGDAVRIARKTKKVNNMQPQKQEKKR